MKKLIWLPIASILSACSPLGLVNGISNVYNAELRKDIAYGEHERHKLDLYLPERDGALSQEETTPVLLFFYGGSWNSGSRSDYRFVGRRLASAGYIVAVADYRLYPEVRYPEFLYDSAGAVRKVSEIIRSDELKQYQPDSKMTLIGHSAGAYNAAMMALDQTWLRRENLDREDVLNGWVGIAGPYDLYPIKIEEVKPVFFHPDYPAESNPIEFAAEAVIPALLLVPEEDDLVDPQRNSVAMANKLQDAGKEVDLQQLQGTSHVTIIGTMSPLLFFKESSVEPVVQFVEKLRK
ncbi:alpha/beta hydrolase [Thalassolituus sp. UBA3500]|uniref:alpha/beta hydrolase n=1 Tax=Thalassolituus sp. UBA3500 TaxID=1947664 RepID=UPI000B7083C1|nr:alpha/beta hydrolase [Thalassolituus sp. UBA3500]MBN57257.1 thioesterase [Oceanospirillaceae bacterium]OUX66714.1 MAG: thioesterase [Oceanospirillaceae bacterium TMED276]|tara:strand:- start:2160 stop:3038 length:879 start_codon:yes stop_codon:yes gene_type:complete